jgi:uncharacterized protein with gpF-like domain
MPVVRKKRVGLPLRSNVGIEVSYRKKLEALIAQMNRSIIYWIIDRPNAAVMANDANRVTALRDILKALRKRWTDRFDDAAKDVSEWFAKQVVSHSALAMTKTLEAGKIPTVKFKMSATERDAVNAVINENVALIKSIPEQHLTAVEGMVMRSVAVGRDLGTLAKELQHQFGVTKKRAALISADQNNKASAVIMRAGMLESGIEYAIWEHSHAGRYPRMEHLLFSGKQFEVAKGAFLEGKWVWPGSEINCRCFLKPVLAGF